jgi:TolA-binding protein
MTTRPDDWDSHEAELVAPVRAELDALRARHRQDPPLDLLRAADAGALPDELHDAVAASLARSPLQRQLVEDLAEVQPELDEAGQARLLARIQAEAGRGATARAPVRRFSVSWRPVLAFAAMAVIVTAVVVRMRPGPEAPVTPTGTSTVAPPAATPSFVLTLDKPDVKLTAKALVRRSTGREAGFVDDIAPAMNAFRAGDYQTAAREFARVAPQYPDAEEIPFYLGVSHLFLGDAPAAITALESAQKIADETFSADVTWYLAVAHERTGDVAAARSELTVLCQGSSTYAARACDAAARLKG